MKWLRLVILAIIISVSLLWAAPVLADSSSDVTITATGVVEGGNPGAPTGLTLTYVSDYEIGISWTKGPSANNTMVRAAYGRVPSSRTDGIELYYGTGTGTTHWVENVGLTGPIYYRAWSEDALGDWEETGTTEEGNFMSASFLFIGLIVLALALTVVELKFHFILLALAASMGWLALGIWLLLGDSANLRMSDSWAQVLGLLFVVMVLVPTLHFLMMMGKTEITTTDAKTGQTYRMWGKPPVMQVESRSSKVKRGRKEKLQAIRAKYRR